MSGFARVAFFVLAFAVTHSLSAQFLINVDFGAGLAKSPKTGPAAIGQGPNDLWNFYTRDDGTGGWRTFGALSDLSLADGATTTVGLTVDNAPGAWGNGSSDPMYDSYIYPFGGNATVTVTNLPVGQYDLYVYSQDGNYQVNVGSVGYGVQTTSDQPVTSPPVWGQGVQYALFQNVAVTGPSDAVTLTVRPGTGGYAIISGIQISSATGGAAPVILRQPQDVTVAVGNNVSFNVSAAGQSPLSFQWQKENVALPGQTGPSLSLVNVQLSDSGTYSVLVTNNLGSVLSSNAVLTVLQASTNFLVDIDFGVGLTPSTKVGAAAIGQTSNDFWNFYSRDDGQGGWRTSGALTNLSLASGAGTQLGLVVDNAPGAWGNGSSDPMYDSYIYPFGGFATLTLTNVSAGQYDIYLYSQDGNYQLFSGDADFGVQTSLEQPVVSPPVWRQGVQYALFQAVPVVSSGQPIVITVRPGAFGYAIIAGMQITASTTPARQLPPTILSQPANTSVNIGSNANFNVLANGTGPFSYQWFFNGTAVGAGSTYSLTLTNVQTNNAGPYSVVVSNAYASVTSSVATLTVSQLAPAILSQPQNQSVLVGSNATFTVTATGASPLGYQWLFNGAPFFYGSNSYNFGSPTLLIRNAQPANSGNYSVRVFNPYGAVTSSIATLTVTGFAPTILADPVSQTVPNGTNVTLSVHVSGSVPLYYQWWFNGTPLTGATFPTLTLSNVATNQSGDYFVEVTNWVGQATSGHATLTVLKVNRPPLANNQNVLTAFGTSAAITLSASDPDGDPISYTIVTPPAHGTLAGTVPNLTYQPATDFSGSDSFTFKASDGQLDSALATVNITVFPKAAGMLIDVDFGAGLTQSPEVGAAAIGQTTNDFWNFYSRDDGQGGFLSFGAVTNLSLVDRTPTSVGVTVANAPGAWVNGSSDPMYNSYIYPFSGNATVSLTNLPVGNYDLYLYSQDGNYDVSVGATDYGVQTTHDQAVASPPVWARGVQYALFQGLAVTNPGDAVVITVQPGTAGSAIIAGLQLASAKALPPAILSQPQDQNVTIGSTATFSVTAAGSPPLTYQWSYDGNVIPGATATSLTMTNIQSTQAGEYSVAVTNAAGWVFSSNALLTVTFPPTQMIAGSAAVSGGGLVTVPILIVANGNENALGFSLDFPSTGLTYAGVTLGSGAQGATLVSNTNQAGSGMLGLLLALAPGATLAPGTQEVAEVSFVADALAGPSTATISFGDQPTRREISDSQANSLPGNYTGGLVSIGAAVFEGDVTPRPNGDGAVSVTDWVLIGRFAARLDYPTNGSEFQRADCAPRNTLGDGSITVADWVQAGRYAAGLDPATVAGGPTNSMGPNLVTAMKGSTSGPAPQPKGLSPRQVKVSDVNLIQGHASVVVVSLNSQGDENAVGFSLSYDPSVFAFSSAELGAGASGATMNLNSSQVSSGRLAFALALAPGSKFALGTRELVKVHLTPVASATGSYSISVTDQPVIRQVVDATAIPLVTDFIGGNVAVNPLPTLIIGHDQQNITLSWPLWATNFTLQESSGAMAQSMVWTNLPVTPLITNGQAIVNLPATGTAKLYRLQGQ